LQLDKYDLNEGNLTAQYLCEQNKIDYIVYQKLCRVKHIFIVFTGNQNN